ncbi:dienelactone hydrolase family protein [Streptomyces nondiastaticus]|uniref:dienelactone hydrolase family protein n=1 Tax=Streptomyces nondiastaticus TaxID=3154512 RepID=UPI0034352C28
MTSDAVRIPADGATLAGDLVVPASAGAVVLFAHGSGSSRLSPRNRAVATALQRSGLATLLMDLLTEQEEEVDALTAGHRFDIALLSGRLTAAIDWLGGHPGTADLPVHLFGASTGAAAALTAAAEKPDQVRSVVSRGGRPDLADDALGRVRAPVLLIVGGEDREVLRLNRAAADRLQAPHEVHVVPGATHLFEEPGALEEVAEVACRWFLRAAASGFGPDSGPGSGSGPDSGPSANGA